MILRSLATLAILGLLTLDLALPSTTIGRRGHDPALRTDVAATVAIGDRLPELTFVDLDGRPVRSEELVGHATLLVFERSVDW